MSVARGTCILWREADGLSAPALADILVDSEPGSVVLFFLKPWT
jgi:hypothetical protein